jgi:hypothetical protein
VTYVPTFYLAFFLAFCLTASGAGDMARIR